MRSTSVWLIWHGRFWRRNGALPGYSVTGRAFKIVWASHEWCMRHNNTNEISHSLWQDSTYCRKINHFSTSYFSIFLLISGRLCLEDFRNIIAFCSWMHWLFVLSATFSAWLESILKHGLKVWPPWCEGASRYLSKIPERSVFRPKNLPDPIAFLIHFFNNSLEAPGKKYERFSCNPGPRE